MIKRKLVLFISLLINWHIRHIVKQVKKDLVTVENCEVDPNKRQKAHDRILTNKKTLELYQFLAKITKTEV